VKKFVYPALYDAAETLSSDSQRFYLRLLRCEYGLLVVASIVSSTGHATGLLYGFSAFIFFVTLLVMIMRNWQKPEQDWYKGRALAESIKTSCWKYAMRAAPFGDEDDEATTREEFQQHLREILSANRSIGHKIPPDGATENQITECMEEIRASEWRKRLEIYQTLRINDQLQWYTDKANENKRKSKLWTAIAILVYLVAFALSLARTNNPELRILPVETLILVASTIVGWTQIKKFNELASSYTLTAHEIGLTFPPLKQVQTQEGLAEFVSEAVRVYDEANSLNFLIWVQPPKKKPIALFPALPLWWPG
jgi:hypothetical protein